VLDDAGDLAGPELADRKDLIRRNCRTLLVCAISEQRGRFRHRLRRTVERGWPFSLRAIRRLRRRAERRLEEAARKLQAQTGASSLLELALDEV